MDNMCLRLLQLFWIVLVIDWRWVVFAETTQSPTLTFEVKANGKINPNSLEILPTTLDEIFSLEPINYDQTDLFDNTSNEGTSMEEYMEKTDNVEDIFQGENKNIAKDAVKVGRMSRKVEHFEEKPSSSERKSRHTTRRSIDFSKKPFENSDFLFLDNDMAGSSTAAKLVALSGESAKDVVKDGIEKDRNVELLGGETAKELLDASKAIPSENQILERMNVVTEISVQEIIDGQTIQRKPTNEELRLVQTKLLTSPMEDFEKDNDIFGLDNDEVEKSIQHEKTMVKNTRPEINTDVEDVSSFLKADPAFADDDTDVFDDWGDSDDINDMESLLKDEDYGNQNENFDKHEQKDTNDQPDPMGKNGDYRKVYHTERQNFSNVKEVKIVISETEGDFFDDDDNFSSDKSSQKPGSSPNVTNDNNFVFEKLNEGIGTDNALLITEYFTSSTSKDNLVKASSTDSSKFEVKVVPTSTEIPGKNDNNNTDSSSLGTNIEVSSATKHSMFGMERPGNSTQNQQQITFNNMTTDIPKTFNETRGTITVMEVNSPSNISQIEISITSKRNETSKGVPKGEESNNAGDSLNDNGVSVKDFSEITSLVEKSYHEIKNSENSNKTDGPKNDKGNSSISDDKHSVSVHLSTELTRNVTSVNSTFEQIDDDDEDDEEMGSTTENAYTTETINTNTVLDITEKLVTIPGDTSTVKIYGDGNREVSKKVSEESSSTSVAPELDTISTKLTARSTDPAITSTEYLEAITEASTRVTENIEKSHTKDHSTEDIVTDVYTTLAFTENIVTTTSGSFIDSPTHKGLNKEDSRYQSSNGKPILTAKPEETSNITKNMAHVATSTTSTTEFSNKAANKETGTTDRELSPTDVESILNSKLEEYESTVDDDYDFKERKNDRADGQNIRHNATIKEGAEANSSLTEIEKQQLVNDIRPGANHFEDYDFLTTADEEGHLAFTFPILKARILNNSAQFSVKISKKDDAFFVPASAYIMEYDNIINITWRANEKENNSVALKIFEKDNFYMIKDVIINIFTGNKFVSQQKPVALNPDPILDDTMPGRTRVIMMRDGTYITFSNVEFLKRALPNQKRENSEAATRDPKLWHFEVASICIATVVVSAIVLYVIAIKTKAKITLREKDELPQVTHC